MLGAMLGDIAGSRFEFDRDGWSKEFELVTEKCSFTDDSVMTLAVAEALLNAGKHADEETIKENLVRSMQKWGRRYPNAGYGARFIHWVFAKNPRPYNSWGNGSAMRVAAAGWLYDSLERTREVARWTAEVTHNHPEGIKGAECTAAVMYLGRTGKGKGYIKEYVREYFSYDVDTTVDEFRKYHHHEESCMDSLPKALVSFFAGNDYEDVIRNAISLGGDTDTLAAIAGAMAKAYYGMPEHLKKLTKEHVPGEFHYIIDRFERMVNQVELSWMQKEERRNNGIENLLCLLQDASESLFPIYCKMLLEELVERAQENGQAPTPVIDVNHTFPFPSEVKKGDTIRLEEDVRFRVDTLKNSEQEVFVPLFTQQKEIDVNRCSPITMNWSIRVLLEDAYYREDVKGLVINPFGNSIVLDKETLKGVIEALK